MKKINNLIKNILRRIFIHLNKLVRSASFSIIPYTYTRTLCTTYSFTSLSLIPVSSTLTLMTYSRTIVSIKAFTISRVSLIPYSRNIRTKVIKETRETIGIIPLHTRWENDTDFGFWLGGYLEGDGWFSVNFNMVLDFHYDDISTAYAVLRALGFGHVWKKKDQKTFLYYIGAKLPLVRVLNLVNGKLRTIGKLRTARKNILRHHRMADQNIKMYLDKSKDYDNNWICGFTDAEGHFEIRFQNGYFSVALKVTQKTKGALEHFKTMFGGQIYYYKKKDFYQYSSVNLDNALKVIKYFDKYKLQTSKYFDYKKWREAFVIIWNRQHLTKEGSKRILELKAGTLHYPKEITDPYVTLNLLNHLNPNVKQHVYFKWLKVKKPKLSDPRFKYLPAFPTNHDDIYKLLNIVNNFNNVSDDSDEDNDNDNDNDNNGK